MLGQAAEAFRRRCTRDAACAPQNVLMKVLQQRHTRVAGTFLEGKRAHAGGCRAGARRRKCMGIAPCLGISLLDEWPCRTEGRPPVRTCARNLTLPHRCCTRLEGKADRGGATRNNLDAGASRSCTDACAAGDGAQARLDWRQEIAKRDEEICAPRLRNLLPQQQMRRQRACITKT